MDQSQMIKVLSGHRTFAGVEADSWSQFIEAAQFVSFNPGEVVYEKSQPCDAGYILIGGRLELIDEPYPGRRLSTQIFSAGNLFSEGGFIKQWPHRRRCTALETTDVLKISCDSFKEVVESGNAVALCVIDRLLDAFVLEVEAANQRLDEIYARPDRTLARLMSSN